MLCASAPNAARAMNELSADTLKIGYFTVAAIALALFAWNGWRQGIFRQAGSIVAIVSAYAAAWFGASSVGPLFGFLHYPRQLLDLVGGLAIGLVALIGLRSLSGILFRRTAEQRPGGARMSYGIFGALLGLAFGLFLFVLVSDAVRILGGLAKTNVDLAARVPSVIPEKGHTIRPVEQPGIFVRSLAKLSGALNADGTGRLMQHYDPVPASVYASIFKLGLVVSSPDALDRFMSFPGVEDISRNPKLTALRDDPEIGELLATNSYLKLLRHERVMALASDPGFAAQIKTVNFEKALDFAVTGIAPAEKQ